MGANLCVVGSAKIYFYEYNQLNTVAENVTSAKLSRGGRDWSGVLSTNNATFTNVPTGIYQLTAMGAIGTNQILNSPITITVTTTLSIYSVQFTPPE